LKEGYPPRKDRLRVSHLCDGTLYVLGEPQYAEDDQLSDAVMRDNWLIKTKVAAPTKSGAAKKNDRKRAEGR